MKVYVPIASYYLADDMYGLFPSCALKGDEANIVLRYFNNGYGSPKRIENPDEESFWTPKQASLNNNMVFTSDGQYVVNFTRGDVTLLRKANSQHGFFIDIYQLMDKPSFEEEQEGGIKDMSYEELYNYTLDLTKKIKEAVTELKRRDESKLK